MIFRWNHVLNHIFQRINLIQNQILFYQRNKMKLLNFQQIKHWINYVLYHEIQVFSLSLHYHSVYRNRPFLKSFQGRKKEQEYT